MDFNDYRAKISIAEMAEYLGYTKVSTINARHLEYTLGDEDKIVIYPNGKGYFSRKGTLDDKGDLIKFVYHRLDKFTNCTETGYKGVNEVLSKYLGSDLIVNRPVFANKSQDKPIPFNLNKVPFTPLKEITFKFLNERRSLSEKTITAFKNRLFIYTVKVSGKERAGFPFRKAGQMEITNFELRDYDYKGFCLGGDKSNSCWIANFVPFDQVTDLYLFESAIDAMSFYEINHFSDNTTSAFVSTGGGVLPNQIKNLQAVFPNVKWNCCFDNDGPGNGFDVVTNYLLKGEECKTYVRTLPEDNFRTVFINFPNGEIHSWKEDTFSSTEFLKSQKKDAVINIIKTPKYKDWNDLIRYYKRFDFNLGPGMKFIPAIEETQSQLNLTGYHQLSEIFEAKGQELIQSLIQRSTYCLSAPLAETNAYKLMVDCNIFMGISTMVPVPNNLYIFDKTTNKTVSAFSMNEFLKKEGINIFRDLNTNDWKNLLEKQVLTYTKGNVERRFERTLSPSGWSLRECAALKKKDIDLGIGL